MEQIRMKALKNFLDRKPPTWAPELGDIDFQSFHYYASPTKKAADSWEQLPDYIKRTYDKLGITDAEKKFLAGVGAIYESEAVYHSIQGELTKQGVVFSDTVTALKQYPEIMKKYFGTVVPYQDNYIAALQTAVWSAGSFVYVPEGVKVTMPLQAYFRINEKNMGQFERTLIIAEPYSEVTYIEGCTAPVYSSQSLHSAIVEIIAKKGSLVKYTTLQNWSRDVLNLVTKRAHAYEDATVSWVDFNGGSRLTRKYPSIYLLGPRAKADIISVAYAGAGQIQDTGGKAIHLAKDTTSKIISRSVSKDGGHTAYRGLLHIAKGATNVKSSVTLRRATDRREEHHSDLSLHGDPGGRRNGHPRGERRQGGRGAAVLPQQQGHLRQRRSEHGRQRLPRAIHKRASHDLRSRVQQTYVHGNDQHRRLTFRSRIGRVALWLSS